MSQKIRDPLDRIAGALERIATYLEDGPSVTLEVKLDGQTLATQVFKQTLRKAGLTGHQTGGHGGFSRDPR